MLHCTDTLPVDDLVIAFHRDFDCPNYDLCLDVASVLGWEGFSCLQCPLRDGPDGTLLGEYLHRISDPEFDEYAPTVTPFGVVSYYIPII